MRRLLALLAMAGSLLAGHATAAPEGAVVLLPNPVECLTPERSQRPPLPYPDAVDARRDGGTVRVRLKFAGAETRPAVEVFYRSGPDAFEQAVQRYVAQYRLPCFAGDEPVVATQEFEFIPGDKHEVIWSNARPEQEVAKLLDCVQHPPHSAMEFPLSALRAKVNRGVLLADLRFTAEGSPPEVKVFAADGDSRKFEDELRRHLANFRMSCSPRGGRPVSVALPVEFKMPDSGGPRWRFNDVTLKTFVSAIRDIDRHRVRFDFTTMGCPFELRLRLWQPFTLNDVGQIGSADPNRREFVEWLRTVSLTLAPQQLRDVISTPLSLSVPCGVFDLR